MKKTENDEPTASPQVDIVTLADLFGISLRTAQRLSQSGVLHAVAVRGKSGKQYFDLYDSVKSYVAYLREQHDAEKGQSEIDKLKAEKLRAEVELKQSQGELHQIKTSLTKGEYLPVDDIRLDYEKFFVVFKKFAMAIPARIGGIVSGYVEPVVSRSVEKDLQQEVNQMLRSFSVAGYTAEEKAN